VFGDVSSSVCAAHEPVEAPFDVSKLLGDTIRLVGTSVRANLCARPRIDRIAGSRGKTF